MRDVQKGRARSRHIQLLGALVAAGLLCAPLSAVAQEQSGASQDAGAAQSAQSAGITFDSDAGILLMYIKPDKTADFEEVMAKLHEALVKSDRPERHQQASGWRLYRASEPGPNGSVMYVNIISPALKGADYTMTKILYEVFPTEVQEMFVSLRDAWAGGMGKLSLSVVQDYTKGVAAAGAPAREQDSND